MLKFEKIQDQQRYEKCKEEFVTKANRQIEVFEALNKAMPVIADVIKSFDGKVLNRRLTKSLDDKLGKVDSHLHTKLDIIYDRDLHNNVGYIEVWYSSYWGGLHDSMRIQVFLSDFSDGNRVVWTETALELDKCKDIIPGYIAEWKKTKKDFDKSYKGALRFHEEIKKMISEYQERYDVILRNFFRGQYIVHDRYYI